MYEFDRPCASNIAIHCYGVMNIGCRIFLGEIHLPGNIHRLAFRPCCQIHINVVITCIADRNFGVARRNNTGVPVRRKIPVACTTIPSRRLDCCPALRRFIVGNGNVLCSAAHRATRIIANDQNLSTLEGNTIGCRACHCDRSTFSRSVCSSLKRRIRLPVNLGNGRHFYESVCIVSLTLGKLDIIAIAKRLRYLARI